MQPSEIVLHLLSSIGSPKEANFYVQLFRAERPESFAIIAVADAVMREARGALLTDIRLLARLGLTPIMQFGVIDPGDARAHAEWVASALAPDIPAQVTTADQAKDLAARRIIPLIPSVGHGQGDQASVDRRFDALAALASEVKTHKIVVIGQASGLEPEGGRAISLVDLTTEYDLLCALLPADEIELMRQAKRLMDAVPQRLTVAVTSPLDLLRELFTMRGAGTLLRRGAHIERFSGFDQVDRDKVRALIESAFGKKLLPSFLHREVAALYVADDYRGIAIIEDTPHGPYLTKFAVDRQAQGEGLGKDLWRALDRNYESLFWRGRADNPITGWYQHQCDGLLRRHPWHVFWRGMAVEQLTPVIQYALSALPDFE